MRKVAGLRIKEEGKSWDGRGKKEENNRGTEEEEENEGLHLLNISRMEFSYFTGSLAAFSFSDIKALPVIIQLSYIFITPIIILNRFSSFSSPFPNLFAHFSFELKVCSRFLRAIILFHNHLIVPNGLHSSVCETYLHKEGIPI